MTPSWRRLRGGDGTGVTVLWFGSDEGPEGFYRRMGFEPAGELFGQVLGVKEVPVAAGDA